MSEVTTTVETKPETQVLAQPNKALAALFKKSAEAENTWKNSWAEALKMIKENRKNCTDEVILLSLMDKKWGRGLAESSAKVELSRIRGLISEKAEAVARYDALQKGEITVQMARKVEREIDPSTGKPKGRGRPQTSHQDTFKKTVTRLCEETVKNLPAMLKDEFLGHLSEAFDRAIAERDANRKAVEDAKATGQIQGGFEPVEPVAAAVA